MGWSAAILGALMVWLAVFSPVGAQQAEDPVQELRDLLRAQQARMDELEKQLQKQKDPTAPAEKENAGEVSAESPKKSAPRSPALDGFLPAKPEGGVELTAESLVAPPHPRAVKDDGMLAVWGKDGRLTFKSEDKSTLFRLGGFFQFDGGWFVVNDSVNDRLNRPLEQGSNLRRARLRSDGYCYDNLEWVFEFDLSRAADNNRNQNVNDNPNPNVMFNNVFLGVRDIPFLGVIRAGHIKEELSFYSASSGRNIPFMERPAAWDGIEDPYLFDNGLTVSNTYFDDFLYTWMGFFQTNTRTGAFAINPAGAYAFDLRACIMPIYEDDGKNWLNLGATGSIRGNPDGLSNNLPMVQASNVQAQIRTGASVQWPTLVNPGNVNSDNGTQLFTLCLNRGYGPWSFGAQYDGQRIGNAFFQQDITVANQTKTIYANIGDIYYQGASFEITRFLTAGDHRGVNKRAPSYLQVIPQRNLSFKGNGDERGLGALELAFKYDFAQLGYYLPTQAPANDLEYVAMRNAAALPGPRGGNLSAFTLGLNWYLNPNALIMTNYVYTTGTFNGKSSASLAPFEGSFHSFGTRFQFVF